MKNQKLITVILPAAFLLLNIYHSPCVSRPSTLVSRTADTIGGFVAIPPCTSAPLHPCVSCLPPLVSHLPSLAPPIPSADLLKQ